MPIFVPEFYTLKLRISPRIRQLHQQCVIRETQTRPNQQFTSGTVRKNLSHEGKCRHVLSIRGTLDYQNGFLIYKFFTSHCGRGISFPKVWERPAIKNLIGGFCAELQDYNTHL